MNQTRNFLAGCDIIDAERGRLEEMKEDKRERDARVAEAKAKRDRGGR